MHKCVKWVKVQSEKLQFEQWVQSQDVVHDDVQELLWIWKTKLFELLQQINQQTEGLCRSFQLWLTLLIRGERVTVAVLLQLLPELHDVSRLHEPLTARNTLVVTHTLPQQQGAVSLMQTYLRRGLTMSQSSVLWMGASWGAVHLNNMESNTDEQENKLKINKIKIKHTLRLIVSVTTS